MVVLAILVLMLAGSIVAALVVPPFLFKIEPSGRVNFFGIPFLGEKAPERPRSVPSRNLSVAVRRDPPARPGL